MVDIDHFLTAPIDVTGRLVDASNATLFGKLDSEIPVIYKPIAGERPLWDFPDGNLASREVAAYRVSELGAFHLVPLTILRNGPYGMGAVQLWIDVDPDVDVLTFGQSEATPLRQMALFDAIINNTDRKYGHLLIDRAGTLFGCDHGVTFHRDNKLRTVLWQWAGQPLKDSEAAQLEKILDSYSHWNLEEFLATEEIAAFAGRVSAILSEGKFPMPSENWPAVPWPPF